MAELSLIAGNEKRLKSLTNKGFDALEDMAYHIPTKYFDFREFVLPTVEMEGKYIAIKGKLEQTYSSEKPVKRASFKVIAENGKEVSVTYFGSTYMEDVMGGYKGEIVAVAGKISYSYEYHKFQMTSPIMFCPIADFPQKIATAYPKWSGFSDQWKRESVHTALKEGSYPEDLPEEFIRRYKLPGKLDALYTMHYPKDDEVALTKAIQRNVYEDLLYFSCKLEEEQGLISQDTPFSFKEFEGKSKVTSCLPYSLTEDQESCINAMINDLKSNKRLNALVQGDVGCGKSIIAYILMTIAAENGYQSVIMAPTVVLAEQHFKEVTALLEPLGIKAVFLGSSISAAERKAATKLIQNGEAKIIVGTHAVMSAKVKYDNLALILVDEEHRFGVKQREALAEKASSGVHQVSFSATPIPRTVATTLYGESSKIYEIKTMPAGRKPVETEIVNGSRKEHLQKLVSNTISRGEQVYVVCPLVDGDDDTELRSVETVAAEYQKYFGKSNIGIATGKMKKADLIKALTDFKEGKTKILISTTVVEVGVNVPNATLIIIEDAYMFGLAGLHQLRGRVGRGIKEGHCILRSDRDSERLCILESTTDGFIIAEKDLELRGAGNLIGDEQSGDNRFMRLAMRYPNLFKVARSDAKECIAKGWHKKLEADIENRSQKVYVRPDKVSFYGSTHYRKSI